MSLDFSPPRPWPWQPLCHGIYVSFWRSTAASSPLIDTFSGIKAATSHRPDPCPSDSRPPQRTDSPNDDHLSYIHSNNTSLHLDQPSDPLPLDRHGADTRSQRPRALSGPQQVGQFSPRRRRPHSPSYLCPKHLRLRRAPPRPNHPSTARLSRTRRLPPIAPALRLGHVARLCR